MNPITFTICYDLARNSPNKRMLPLAKARVVKNFRKVVRAWMLSAGICELPQRADVKLLIRKATRMDRDNIIGAFKPAQDEMWAQDKDVSIVDVQQEIGPQWRDREEIVVTIKERK